MKIDPFEDLRLLAYEPACTLSVVGRCSTSSRPCRRSPPAGGRAVAPAAQLGTGYFDDGSTDATPHILHELQAVEPAAGRDRDHAGLRMARGAATMVMDGCPKHPPQEIPAMLSAWRAGQAWLKRRAAACSTASALIQAAPLPVAVLKKNAAAAQRLLDRAGYRWSRAVLAG